MRSLINRVLMDRLLTPEPLDADVVTVVVGDRAPALDEIERAAREAREALERLAALIARRRRNDAT